MIRIFFGGVEVGFIFNYQSEIMKREIASASYEKEMHPIMLLFFLIPRKRDPEKFECYTFLKRKKKKKRNIRGWSPLFLFFCSSFPSPLLKI